VTHDQEEAFSMSDTVAIMNKGQIKELGSPEELYTTPRSTFGAEFMGTRTKLPGTVDAKAEDRHLVVSTPIGKIRCRHKLDHAPGAPVIVYVRPSEVAPAQGPVGPGGLAFPALIESIEFVGDTVNWLARSGESVIHGRSLLGRPDCATIRSSIGQTIELQIQGACCVAPDPA